MDPGERTGINMKDILADSLHMVCHEVAVGGTGGNFRLSSMAGWI